MPLEEPRSLAPIVLSVGVISAETEGSAAASLEVAPLGLPELPSMSLELLPRGLLEPCLPEAPVAELLDDDVWNSELCLDASSAATAAATAAAADVRICRLAATPSAASAVLGPTGDMGDNGDNGGRLALPPSELPEGEEWPL
mmetsp:Transcript_97093/g.187159  ORF Transcript_97093/g.187159 Transcript_97093/m.187159 type:complete len:143 (+) Transcript_97093:1605-2033(+)